MKTIKASLSQRSIQNMISKLEEYKTSLEAKNIEFQKSLANLGMKVAWYKANELDFGSSIHFKVEAKSGETALVGFSVRQAKVWDYFGQRKVSYEFSPILMAEFGAGTKADSPQSLDDGTMVGQGTYPDQTHADEKVWKWKDLDGAWHSNSGITPTKPMHSAYEEMYKQIEKVAREVFG